MTKIKKLAGVLLIVMGLGLVLYPKLSQVYYDQKQAALLEAQLEMLREISVVEDEAGDEIPELQQETTRAHASEVSNNTALENNERAASTEAETTAPPTTLSREERNQQILNYWPVEAVLNIPKIDLMMPVIADATLDHLDVSASSITGTGTPWKGGNYAIAGHRSRSFGRHFNRLDELTIGDQVEITDLDGNVYDYTVYEKQVVDETDLSVLTDEGFDEVTLITCHPITEQHPTTRLIVKARLETQP